MDKPIELENWSTLCSLFTGSAPDFSILEAQLDAGRFPSLTRSSCLQLLSEDELQRSKEIFNKLAHNLSTSHAHGRVSSIRFCRDVGNMVKGNVALFEPITFKTLLDSLLTVKVVQSNAELRQNLSAGLASLLYLCPINYRAVSGTTGTTAESSKVTVGSANPDFLDFQSGESCLDLLTSLLEMAKEDTKTELSCFHALVQLLCHRKLFHPTRLIPAKLDRLVRVTQVIWPVAFCISNRQSRWEEGSAPISSSSSICPSSSGGDVSDAGGTENCAVRELKKSRLLATFCLRRLLTSKRICRETWTSTGIRSFQSDFLEAVCRERDARLRELFIVMLGVVLDNLALRFIVAEEPSNWQPTTFIPYSLRVAGELRALHRSLIWALRTERSFRHQLALLKVFAVLITVTPYYRLHSGLLSNVITNLNSFHNQTHCISPILPVWNTILAKTPTPEVQRLLTSPTPTLRVLSLCDTSSMSPNPCWLVLLCLQLVDTGGRLVENEKGTQPAILRSQAVSTLTAFVPLHYDCLVPSMKDIKRMIESGFWLDREENRSFRIPLLRFCDALLTHAFECLEEKEKEEAEPDYDWWLRISGTLVSIAGTFIDDSERWWLCQVLGSLFELIALLPRSRPLPASFVAICTSLCTRAVNLLASFCTCSGVETRLKALRKLCTIAILDGPFVPPNLLSYAMKIIFQMYPLATARIACEIAYCLEICTMKALTLQNIPEDWSLPSILQVVIGLSARLFPDAKNVVWTGQDGYRCEHALQTLANLVELASKSLDFLDSHYSTVLNVFHTCLHTTNISGAEKIRWNAALASSRLLQTISNGDQLVEALCVAFTTDSYFKVRAYAGLSLLLQLLRVPSIRQTSSILDCCLQFLSNDLKHYFTKLVAADALQYQVVCPYIAERLLLQAGILSMRALQQNWTEGLRNLNRIAKELEGNETLCENLKNSLQYAKDAKVAATAVVKENADEMARGGLARVSKHPMIISFAERYSLLRTLKLDEAVNELSEAVKTFEREVQIADGDSSLTRELIRGLTRLINATKIDETVESLQRIHLSSLDDQSSAPSQTTDASAVD